MKSVTENVVSDFLCKEHLHAIIEPVEDMLRTTCHIVIKTHVKFMLIGLHVRHDGHVW